MGEFGALYLSGARNDYWGSDRLINTVSAGYNGRAYGVSYGLAYSIDRIEGKGGWPENRQLSFNMQVPFSLFSASPSLATTYASYQMSHNRQGQVQQQAGVNGSALDDRLSYNIMQGWSNSQSNDTSTLNAGYQGSKGMATAGYSYSRHNRSLNLGGNGGVVVHPEGVTLSQMLGSAVAVVSAPGAANTQVMTGNVQTDSRGYAVVPYLANYQSNPISLNPATLPDDVDMTQSSVNVYPTKGAVVMANFATQIGYQALVTLQRAGAAIPFGATVTVNAGTGASPNTGIVGEGGQVYLSGLPEHGQLRVKWGNGVNQQCQSAYNLALAPAPTASSPMRTLAVRCG